MAQCYTSQAETTVRFSAKENAIRSVTFDTLR